MQELAVTHACILSLALLTPFTLSPSVDVFFAFRMVQTALMGQYVLLHPKANSKLQALLKGTPLRRIFFCTSWDDLTVAFQCFKHSQAVYVRFCHIANSQPKFYLGSTSSFVLDREHSRYRKFLQVQQNKFVLAEVADRFWMWSVFPIYTKKSNFWALEQAFIQLWQPQLNTHSSCKVPGLTSIWILLVVAQTTMEVNPCTSSTSSSQPNIWSPSSTVGNHPRPWEQLCQTIPHGKTTTLQ